MKASQRGLQFQRPVDAIEWPNGLGFDWRGLEFWVEAGGVRDLEALTYGVGDSWVSALSDLVREPKAVV